MESRGNIQLARQGCLSKERFRSFEEWASQEILVQNLDESDFKLLAGYRSRRGTGFWSHLGGFV